MLHRGIDALGSVVVECELEDGTIGVGVSIGGEPACYLIEKHLSRFVEGQDVHNTELMWEQMFRASLPYGRKGLPIQAISAVDLAVWDCLGKHHGEPIYNLIGGKVKERLPIYATTSRPDLAQELGFVAAKFPLPYSHLEGAEGLRKNVAEVARWREAVGPDFPLMIDCYMSLTPAYTIELARAVEPYNVKWIEEVINKKAPASIGAGRPFVTWLPLTPTPSPPLSRFICRQFLPPDDYDGYEAVKRAVGSCLLTTGEHEYTRYGFRELIKRRAVDILQPDITWCGGLTEALKIYHMAAAYDIPCIPHGSSVFSYHLQVIDPLLCLACCPRLHQRAIPNFVQIIAGCWCLWWCVFTQMASTNSYWGECIMMAPKADYIAPAFGNLFTNEPLPVDGHITLADVPGWSVLILETTRTNPDQTVS